MVVETIVEVICLTKLQILEQFLALTIVIRIVIIFYKMIHNTKLTFYLVITRFYNSFCAKILTFLFAMIHCNIKNTRVEIKLYNLLIKKLHKVYIAIHSFCYANSNDSYIYTNFLAMV